ncbi:hypothetical protein CYMTET_31320 [Cymbomonas tetramitiformis]|uniref:Polysaccharide lyase 14 domain-containing protein n=1 Tax=Cymbomonas tetramitiformis TaxID=36881 RepID=A0AAE0FHS8_9CHLO|nr:hypothetical protein CYMTET_31320 [Cymbomonas tetramitiformis]
MHASAPEESETDGCWDREAGGVGNLDCHSDSDSEEAAVHRDMLRVHIPRGTWAPQATQAAGMTPGGVAAWSLWVSKGAHLHLDVPVQSAALSFRIRFPSTFDFGKGGTLPGLHCRRGLRVRFGWRSEGRCVVTVDGVRDELKALRDRRIKKHDVLWEQPPVLSPGCWHTLRLRVCLQPLPPSTTAKPSAEALHAPPATCVARVRGWCDDTLVEEIEIPCDVAATATGFAGVLLSCFYGGGSSDWAAPASTSIDFDRFAVHLPQQHLSSHPHGGTQNQSHTDHRDSSGNHVIPLGRPQCPPKLARPAVIFCASPGRCGTLYLSSLLATAEAFSTGSAGGPPEPRALQSTHEPAPQVTYLDFPKTLRTHTLAETFEPKAGKGFALRRAIGELGTDGVYIETSHMFVKTWMDVAYEMLAGVADIHVVILRRYVPEMLMSRASLGHMRGGVAYLASEQKDDVSPPNGWINTAFAPCTMARPPRLLQPVKNDRVQSGGAQEWHDSVEIQLQLLMGYHVDVEARVQHMIKTYASRFTFVETTLKDLNTPEGVGKLFSALKLRCL